MHALFQLYSKRLLGKGEKKKTTSSYPMPERRLGFSSQEASLSHYNLTSWQWRGMGNKDGQLGKVQVGEGPHLHLWSLPCTHLLPHPEGRQSEKNCTLF